MLLHFCFLFCPYSNLSFDLKTSSPIFFLAASAKIGDLIFFSFLFYELQKLAHVFLTAGKCLFIETILNNLTPPEQSDDSFKSTLLHL